VISVCDLASLIAELGAAAVRLRYHKLHTALEEAGTFLLTQMMPAERLQADVRLLRLTLDALTGEAPVMPEVIRRVDQWLGI
jgi:hypothetical protein